jgi:hypothetical protein
MTSEEGAEEEGRVDDGQAGHVGVHDVVGPKLFSWVQFNNFQLCYRVVEKMKIVA